MHTVTSQPPHPMCGRIAELLPWYLNGTSSGTDRAMIEAHCSACEHCAAALRLERRVIESIRAPRVHVEQSPIAAWQRFEARLDKPGRQASPHVPHRERRSPGFRVVIAAQAAAIAALAILLVFERSVQEAPRFRTLSNADETLVLDQPLVRITFDAEVSPREAAAIAADAGGRVIGGPSPDNVYTVTLSAASDGASVAQRVALLRRHPHVLLAEPITLEPRS